MIAPMTTREWLLAKFNHLRQYYGSYEEFEKHLFSGEVTMNVSDALEIPTGKQLPGYTEAQLISFGNYLLEHYGVMVYSNDGKNTPIYPRTVHHADHCNWENEWNASVTAEPEVPAAPLSLPSTYQLGDKVWVKFGLNNPDIEATVRGVHFFPGKVKYDVMIPVEMEDAGDQTRVYNVDSTYVTGQYPLPNPLEGMLTGMDEFVPLTNQHTKVKSKGPNRPRTNTNRV